MKSGTAQPPSQPTDPIAAALRAVVAPIVADAVRAALEEHRDGEAPREQLLDNEGLCAFLQCSPPTARKLLAEGLPFVQVGDHRRYSREDVLAWLRSRRGPR